MRKLVFSLIALCFSLAQLAAQEPTFEKGDRVANFALGLGSTLYSGTYYKSQIPPISASLEYGIVDNILDKGVVGVGPYVGFSSYKYEYSNWGYKYSNLIIGAKGNFHYPLADKLDTYTGLILGYNIRNSKEFGTAWGYDYSASSGGIVASWFIGGRYYFQDNLAVMAELGYGIAYLNIGVSLKF